jgi:hypothetical protein
MPKSTKAKKITDLKAVKPWLKKRGLFQYRLESIEKKKRFLIVCEGQTEELYFKSFPVLTADVKLIHQGLSKSSLVVSVGGYMEGENYDEVWCVFDMDYKPDENKQFDNFNNSIKAATKMGYKCAYSNDAFELWFILHYQYLDQQHHRDFFYKKLSEFWDINYEKKGKSKVFAQSIYNRLSKDMKASQQTAIKNARKLHQIQNGKLYHLQNPVTTVYLLVEELNRHLFR